MKKFKKNNKGFSLVELIVVIAIMAILGVAVALAVTKFIPQSQRSTDISNATMIAEACEVAVNDFATSADNKIGTVAYSSVFSGSGDVKNVSLDNLKATGLLKDAPKIQGKDKNENVNTGNYPTVTYNVKTGEVVVNIAKDGKTAINLMDSTTALNYKNDELS